MCCRERAIPMQKYLFPIRLQWARHRLFVQRGADSAKEGIRAGKSVRCRVACGGLLAKGAVFRGKWRSAVHPSSQRAASAVAAHCIGTCSALHIPAHFCSFAKRVAPERPTGNATMANERYRNSHYIPFHQLKLCAEICCPAHSVLHLRPLKPKHRHGFHTPCSTIRHRADRQAGAPSGGRARRPYALPPIPHATPLTPATAVFCGAQPLIMACRLV